MNRNRDYLMGHAMSKIDTAFLIMAELSENSIVISGQDKIDMHEAMSLLDKIEKRLEASN